MNIREKKQTSTELNVTKQNVTNEKPRESLQNPHEHSKSSAHKAPKIINLSRSKAHNNCQPTLNIIHPPSEFNCGKEYVTNKW